MQHRRLRKVNAELEKLIPKDELATEFTVLTYQDTALEILGQLKAGERRLRQTHCATASQARDSVARPSQTPKKRTPSKEFKLLTLELKTFARHIYHWPLFREQFRNAVEENENLTKEKSFNI